MTVNDEARAVYDVSAASYRQTVLSAFQQPEHNLAALRVLEHEAAVQATALQYAKRSLDLSNTRYEGGVTSYLEVITAQHAALSDEVRSSTFLMLLIEALCEGWGRSNLPHRPSVVCNWQ